MIQYLPTLWSYSVQLIYIASIHNTRSSLFADSQTSPQYNAATTIF